MEKNGQDLNPKLRFQIGSYKPARLKPAIKIYTGARYAGLWPDHTLIT